MKQVDDGSDKKAVDSVGSSSAGPPEHQQLNKLLLDESQTETVRHDCKRRKRVYVIFGGITAVLTTVGLTAIAIVILLRYTLLYSPERQFAAVFDAGSSHTRMFLYSWPNSVDEDYVRVQGNRTAGGADGSLASTRKVRQVATCDGGHALSEIAKDYKAVEKLFGKCFDQARSVISPIDLWPDSVRIYLGATAGIRLQCVRNAHVVDNLFVFIRQTITDMGLMLGNGIAPSRLLPPPPSPVRVLTGDEEAANGWMSANYLLDRLNADFAITDLVGALDLGGASTQISFVPENARDATIELRLYGKPIGLFVRSYICYGVDEARRIHQQQLVLDQHHQQQRLRRGVTFNDVQAHHVIDVDDPCLPYGYIMNRTSDKLFYASPCTQSSALRQSFENDRTLSQTTINRGIIYRFMGRGDYRLCQGNVTKSLFPPGDSKKVPKIRSIFLAFSAFSYTLDFLYRLSAVEPTKKAGGLSAHHSIQRAPSAAFHLMPHNNALQIVNVNLFQIEMEKLCSIESYTELISRAVWTSEKYLPLYCFNSIYAFALLTKKFGISEEKIDSIRFVKNIAGSDVEWALGFMLNETSIIPLDGPKPKIDNPTYVAALTTPAVISGVVLSAFLVFLVLTYCRRKNNQQQQRLRDQDQAA